MTEEKRVQQEPEQDAADFARQAEQDSDNIVVEFWYFLRYNKKWWLTPIIAMLLLIGVLVLMSGSAALAPFLSTLW